LFLPRVPDAPNKKHYELIKNCAADQRRKSKSPPLQQQWHVVVPLHRTSSGFHKTPNPDVVANAKSSGSASEARPLVLGNSESNRMKSHFSVIEESPSERSTIQVPVPSDWFGKPWSYVMTFEEAQKAFNSNEQKQAVALMKKIDKQLGIEAELTSGIYDTPDGASVVIVHDIKTPLDWETLQYIAAVKGKALLDESPHSNPPRKAATG
jgi:hypothetical protein